MNRKIVCVFGLLLFSFALPSSLLAQNLILDGGFDSGALANGLALRATGVYGQWAGVHGEYGWTFVETGSNKVLSICGKGYAREKVWLNQGKRTFQEVSGKSILPGAYTLKFRCQCASILISMGHMEVSVAQRTDGPADIIVHIEKPGDKDPRGYKILTEQPLLTGQQSEITGSDKWRTVEVSFDVPEAGKSLLVMFTGMADTGTFQIDDVSLTRKGGSPVPPEKSRVDERIIIKPLEIAAKKAAASASAKSAPVTAPAPVVAPAVSKPAPVVAAVAPVAKPAPVVIPAPAPVVAVVAPVAKPAPVVVPAPAPVVAAVAPVAKPAPVVIPAPAPVVAAVAPVAKPAPAPAPAPRPPAVVLPVASGDIITSPNLIRDGDFSAASLAVSSQVGSYSSELSGRWLRSNENPWQIVAAGGNLGAYAQVATSSDQPARMLYIACNNKNASGRYRLNFDYVVTDPSDTLAVSVFAVDENLLVGPSVGQFHMDKGWMQGMTSLPASPRWKAGSLSVDLGAGYNYVYVLFVGTGKGCVGVDNVTLTAGK